MNNIKSHLVNLVVNLSLFAVLFIFHYSGLFTIDILGAKPIIPLSLLVAVCMKEYCLHKLMTNCIGGIK